MLEDASVFSTPFFLCQEMSRLQAEVGNLIFFWADFWQDPLPENHLVWKTLFGKHHLEPFRKSGPRKKKRPVTNLAAAWYRAVSSAGLSCY